MNPQVRPLKEWYKPIVIDDARYLYDPEAQSFYQEFLGQRFDVTPAEIANALERFMAHVQKVCSPDYTFPIEE